MSERPETEPGLVLADRYHLRAVLGRGGAGTVWCADDHLLDRQVALKLLHPELERDTSAVVRFRREATAAAALTHPNAVIVYDIGEDDGRIFLVMELVEGVTLSDLLADGQLPPDDTISIGVSVARALGAAHRRGLVHRDIKPGNVLINREGMAKVVDFGIATALGDAQARLTVPGMVVGTSTYLAPEQLEGKTVDGRADVYSLGLVLHECLTGEPTFSGGTAVEVATRRLASEAPAPSELTGHVPHALDLAIHRATRRDPAARFEDGAAFAAALEPLVPDDAASRLARLVASRLGPEQPQPVVDHRQQPTSSSPTSPVVPVGGGDEPTAGGTDASVTTPLAPTASRTRATDERATAPATAGGAAGAAAAGAGGTAGAGGAPPGSGTTTLPATEPADPQPAPPRRSPWSQPWPWLLALAVVALFAVAIVDVIQGDGDGPDSEGDGGEVEALTIADGGDFDPFSDDEHPEDIPRAFDGDPATAWQTQRYNSAALGGLKPGVGMWVDLGEPSALRRIDLELAPAGADLAVYAGNEAPPGSVGEGWSPGDWGTLVAEVPGAATSESLDVEDLEARYVLLWFTSLPADGGGHRVHVHEVSVAG